MMGYLATHFWWVPASAWAILIMTLLVPAVAHHTRGGHPVRNAAAFVLLAGSVVAAGAGGAVLLVLGAVWAGGVAT